MMNDGNLSGKTTYNNFTSSFQDRVNQVAGSLSLLTEIIEIQVSL